MAYVAQAHRPNGMPRTPSRHGLPDHLRVIVRKISNKEFHVPCLPIDDDPGTFPDRQAAEEWLARNLENLHSLHQRRTRPCLCCGAAFESEGPHNRLCAPCRIAPDDIDSTARKRNS
jgi:hypothetical protein